MPLQSLDPLMGDLALDTNGSNLSSPAYCCVDLGKSISSLNLHSGNGSKNSTYLIELLLDLRAFADVSGLLSLWFEEMVRSGIVWASYMCQHWEPAAPGTRDRLWEMFAAL